MNILNQFSFVITFAVIGTLVALFLTTRRSWNPAIRVGVLLGIGIVAVGVILAFRYPSDDSIDTVDDVEAIITNGSPTFVMLYSNY